MGSEQTDDICGETTSLDAVYSPAAAGFEPWPDLPLKEWQDSYATLHMWTQIVGKIRLTQTSWVNHSWHVSLYLTSRGLTTSPLPLATGPVSLILTFSTTGC